jgi:hypothetical protein
MIYLDALWNVPRSVKINGKNTAVPFGINLPEQLAEPIAKWIGESGVGYAQSRCKKLKTWAIHILAGETNYKLPWFTNRRFRGTIIPDMELFEYLLRHRNNLRVVKAVLVVLNSYKLVVTDTPSHHSVTKVPVPKPSDPYISKLRMYVDLPRVPPQVLERTESVNTTTKFCDDYGRTFSGPIGLKDEDIPAAIRFLHEDLNSDPLCLGKLVPIRDKGKWRNILVGHWAIQLQCKKLSDWLRTWLWSLEEISSGNQKEFSTFIIESLSQDKYMMSIDLSEATDRLDRKVQIKLLESMGVPKGYFNFLSLPFYYDKSSYGEGKGLKKAFYRAGQPMGLYISFPMFELMHYVILKFVIAGSDTAQFRICGDDVVISCADECEARILYKRYYNLITRFGGIVSKEKSILSGRLSEGVGAIFLKGYPKEIRIPSGKLSTLEASTPLTWLNQAIAREHPVGRSVMGGWLSTKLTKRYTYDQRREANKILVSLDLSDWGLEGLRQLVQPDNVPLEYWVWNEGDFRFWRNTPAIEKVPSLRWLSVARYRDYLVSHKLVQLYKEENSL